MNKNEIILFWSTFNIKTDKDYINWINKKINISAFHLLSLTSHIKLKNNTTLYSYQKFNKGQVPKGIKIKDANDIFDSKKAFDSLINGHSIAHISDAVRLNVASKKNGIVMDMDAIILKELPKLDSWYASMPAKLTGGMAPRWGNSHPPLYINDNSWDGKALASFPIKVSDKTKKDIENLSLKIIKTLAEPIKKGSLAWNYVLWSIKDIIKTDEKGKVFKPIYFCPLPAWLRKGNGYSLESPTRLDGTTELFGYKMPSIINLFTKSFLIQHFFDSAAHKQGGYGVTSNEKENNEITFWKNLHKDSLLGCEAYLILGINWRNKLIEREIQINKK